MTDSPQPDGAPPLSRPVRWQAGAGHGLVWPRGLALVAASVDPTAIEQIWLGCREHTLLGEFLELLSSVTGTGLLGLPDFAIAVRGADAWQVAARGAFAARAAGEGTVRLIDGSDVTTWAESRLSNVTGVTLSGPATDGPDRPLVAGVVPAGRLEWSLTRASAPDDPHQPAPRGLGVPAAIPTVPPRQQPEPVTGGAAGPLHPGGVPDPATPSTSLVAPPAPPAGDESVGQESAPGESALPAPPSRPVPAVSPGRPVADIPAEDPATDIVHLWEETILAPVEQAAIRGDVPPSGPPLNVPTGGRAPDVGGSAGTLLGDHDGDTIMAADLIAAARAGADGRADPPVAGQALGDGTLVGALCEQGHANPPQRSVCRVCGGPVVGEPRRVPRPPLGRIRTSTGEVIDLVVPVVVGRNPRADRFEGPTPPRLLALPHNHVSGTHLAIELEGWNVLAVDQHSRNGTFLRRHGEPPTRLPQTPILLIDGDVLDLGHGVTLTMEALP